MEIQVLTGQMALEALPPRTPGGAKWDHGSLLIVAGSEAMPGAATLCAGAAVRSGAGLVRLASVKDVCLTAAGRVPPCTHLIVPADWTGEIDPAALPALVEAAGRATALVIGPGLGRGDGVMAWLPRLLAASTAPVVIDADGLNTLAALPGGPPQTGGPWVLTPHIVEFARLTGLPVEQLSCEPASHAARYAACHRVTLVLKGPQTLVARPDGTVLAHSRENSGLAKGGSGDVLAGLLGGLLAQQGAGGDPALAAACAVWLHGQAGWRAREALGEYAMTPRDVIEYIPHAFKDLLGDI